MGYTMHYKKQKKTPGLTHGVFQISNQSADNDWLICA
jgi:hypothetical protein